MNATVQSRQRKRSLSLTPRSKEKLLPPILPQLSRIRQIHLWQPYLPRILPPRHLCPLLPRNNPILCRWTSSKLASNDKLTSDKYKKYLENNLCLYCGVGDHKLDSCSKKQTTVMPKGRSTSATASKKPLEKQRATLRTLHRLRTALNFPVQ